MHLSLIHIYRVVGVVDETGAVISCSELNLIGEVREGCRAERLTAGDRFVRDGYTYQQFSSAKHNDYAEMCIRDSPWPDLPQRRAE